MRLHERLRGKSTTDKKINLHKHISKVKKEAPNWLEGIPKNGIDHSQRLEDYLNRLIPDDFKKRLEPAEVFILLYAVYLHDIGYRKENGKPISLGHPLSSKEYILNNPDKYLFNEFPRMNPEEPPLAAQAVAEVCYGHAPESICPLNNIPNKFGDAYLSQETLNLRRVTALLRLADEMDQPYIRLGHLREHISLPEIGRGIVRWHWRGDESIGEALSEEVQRINKALEPVNDCLSEWGFPETTVVLKPPVEKPKPPPPEPKDYREFIPKHYIPPRCHDEKGKDKGPLHSYVHDWLKDPKRKLLAVLGDYGIGKTSFCYKFASDLSRSQCIPIVVELRCVREKGWREVIQEEIDSRAPGSTENVLLILDGFDELSLTFDKEAVLKEIENLSQTTHAYKRVILTSRTQFFRSPEEEKETLVYKATSFSKRGPRPLIYSRFERVYISPFNDKEIKQYLSLCLGKKEAQEFWSQTIEVVFDIKNLARRPILLNLIVYDLEAIQDIEGKVTPGKLYKTITERLSLIHISEPTRPY